MQQSEMHLIFLYGFKTKLLGNFPETRRLTLEHLSEFQKITTTIHRGNIGSVKFFTSCGFEIKSEVGDWLMLLFSR